MPEITARPGFGRPLACAVSPDQLDSVDFIPPRHLPGLEFDADLPDSHPTEQADYHASTGPGR